MNPFWKSEPRDSFGRWSDSGLDAHTKARREKAASESARQAAIRAHNSNNIAWRQKQKMKPGNDGRGLIDKAMGTVFAGKWEREENMLGVNRAHAAARNAATLKSLEAERNKGLKQFHDDVNHPGQAFRRRVGQGLLGLAKKLVSRKYR